MRIAHLVVTANFAGTERYVLDLAVAQAARGHRVAVVGGDPDRMLPPLEAAGVDWRAGGDLRAAAAGLRAAGPTDVLHSHLTAADLLAGAWPRRWARRRVSTRHIAGVRGSRGPVRLAAGLLGRRIDVDLAISHSVAGAMERPPDAVVLNGVAPRPASFSTASRTVLVAQRLQPEKCTALAVDAFARSGLVERGWRLQVAGDGPDRGSVSAAAERSGVAGAVDLLGWRADVGDLMAAAGIFLATARSEPLGLSVLEAMSRGIPVLATAAGGHLETVGSVSDTWLTPPDDAEAMGGALRRLGSDDAERSRWGTLLRAAQQERFSHDEHTDTVLRHYQEVQCASS